MLNLTAGGLSGGYRTYLHNLLPLLRTHAAIADLFVAVPPGHGPFGGSDAGTRTYNAGEHWRGFPSLRKEVRAWKPDIVLVPTARYLDCDAPCVSMVRNMEPMLRATPDDGVMVWAKHRARELLAKSAVRRATRVIAVSGFVRDFLVNQWHVSAHRVGVVYHGVKPGHATNDKPAGFNLPNQPFVFAAGSLLPYRGLEDAIQALALISAPVTLAVAGEGSSVYIARLKALATQVKVSDRVLWLGQLSSPAMAWAYQKSVAFLMTSRVEACPNTALECMANGSVCISTSSAPMPEFFADVANYYTAGDAPVLAKQIMQAWTLNAVQRTARGVAARERSHQFGWDRTANGTVAELQLALQQS